MYKGKRKKRHTPTKVIRALYSGLSFKSTPILTQTEEVMKEDILVDLLKDGKFKSRKYLASALNLEKNTRYPDRALRKIKESINLNDGRFKDVLIIGFSSGKGYKIADKEEELIHYILEMRARKESLVIQIDKAERILRRMEKVHE